MRGFVALLLVLSMSGSGAVFENDSDLEMIADEEFVFEPAVSAELTWESERSVVGWGSFDLTAEPAEDELHVYLLVGTPASQGTWQECSELNLEIDGARSKVSTRYAGRPMRVGVFDAVTAQLEILDVRRMSRSRDVAIDLCGERVVLSDAQLAELRDFVRRFDDLAVYDGESLPSPPPELGPEHEWGPARPLVLPHPV